VLGHGPTALVGVPLIDPAEVANLCPLGRPAGSRRAVPIDPEILTAPLHRTGTGCIACARCAEGTVCPEAQASGQGYPADPGGRRPRHGVDAVCGYQSVRPGQRLDPGHGTASGGG
jgi:hypothetical protein